MDDTFQPPNVQPNVFLPPAYPAVWTHGQYLWCQVRSVVARELSRAQHRPGDPLAWIEGWWSEAGEVEDALRKGLGEQAALGYGSGAGEANWQDVACFAWAYASYPSETRAQIRQAIAAGQVSPVLYSQASSVGACPKEVAADPAYFPGPACYPVEAAKPAAVLAASAGAGALVAFVIVKLISRKRT